MYTKENKKTQKNIQTEKMHKLLKFNFSVF